MISIFSYKGLLEQSGIKHNLSPTSAVDESTTEADTSAPGSSKKPSLGEKIKDKLHLGKK